MNLEGKLLSNRYEIEKKIGNGGMATVYKATDIILKRQVAVKILRDEFTTDEEFIRRFEAEAQSAARLTHANIVSIYDVGVEGSLYFIVMELIQGKTLKEIIIEENGPLPWKWSINVAIQIAQALEMAHRNNIIHRDIKPHNIIITEEGVAKVTDFGIAKAVSNSTITAFGTTIGSVHYFSPEHARGGFTDAKSDLYSLGVVMYEMLTGKVPFDADTPVSVALKHMQEEPVEPIQLNPNMPKAVNKIIMKALKKDPTLRYQSSTEMLRDLKEALKNPNGDFVEDREYDKTARTQKVDLSDLADEEEYDDEDEYEDENRFKAFIREHALLSAFLGIVILFFIVFGITMLVLGGSNPKETAVPNVIGMTQEEAKKQIEDAKLVYEVEAEEYSKDVEAGKIISIRTEIGDQVKMVSNLKVKEGSKIFVVISKGQEKTKIPNVKGKEKEEAIKLIEDAKLKVEIEEENSKTVKENFVISQDTEPDTEVFAGDTLKIHVSKGVEKVTMISVIDKDEEEAKTALKALGITNINIAYEENSSKATGKVIKQSIESGSSVEKEASITITVNTYKEKKTVTLSINVKALTGGYTENKDTKTDTKDSKDSKEETKTETEVKKTVDVSVSVDGAVVETRPNVDKNTTELKISITNTGSKTITVDAGGAKTTKTVDFSTASTVTVP
ncbi:MAG: Stk1 family PASTA domain-containing Ser/Thr kinase [Clostridia bacterium]|nr:Stk1 family PASTA domain-containing Ser/Thr kinase [Clostridia bacterium]